MNVGGSGHLYDITGAVWRHVMFFSVVLLHLKKDSPLSTIVFDYALTKFTPRLQKCFVDSNTSLFFHITRLLQF